MKLLLTILCVIAIGGCNHKSYRNDFHRMIDSCQLYHEKFLCALTCNKIDSLDYYITKRKPFLDSVNYFFFLMYPDEKIVESKPEKENCNCQ